jgi:hypothetical protein
MDKRGGFFKPFKPLDATFIVKAQIRWRFSPLGDGIDTVRDGA